jgi:hypothetical protein
MSGFNKIKSKRFTCDTSGLVVSQKIDLHHDNTEAHLKTIRNSNLIVGHVPSNMIFNDKLKYTVVEGSPDEDATPEITTRYYDPRCEYVIGTATSWRGGVSGGSGGVTLEVGIGCGRYHYNEPIEQNMNYIQTYNTSTSETLHTKETNMFGTSSVRFGGAGGGGTGGYFEIPTSAITGGTGGEAINENVRIQFWMRYNSLPSADETIIARRTGTGAGGVSDAFRVHFDQSSNAIKFDVSDYSDTSSGFAHSTNIASGTTGANGITLGVWHNCTVTYKYAAGIASVCNVYWDGERKNQITRGLTGPMLTPNIPITVGADNGGFYPYSGYMDELHIFAGPTSANVFSGVTGATYDYYDGATAAWSSPAGLTGVSGEGSVAYDTVAFMSMDGPSGCYAFSMQSKNHIYAICSGYDNISKNLFVREVGLSGDATGGFNTYQDGGTSGTGITQGYVVGYDSDAHHFISSVDNILSLPYKKEIKKLSLDNASEIIIGITLEGTSGAPGASNDFLTLFGITPGSPADSGGTFGLSGGSGGKSGPGQPQGYSDGFSFVPDANNLNELSLLVEYINTGNSGPGGGGTPDEEFQIPDADNWIHVFAAQDVLDLYADVMGFRQATHNDKQRSKDNIDNSTSGFEITNTNLASSTSYSQGTNDPGKGK